MDVQSTIAYRVDGEDRLVAFNDEWLGSAQADVGAALAPALIRGRLLWEFLDPTTAQLYQRIIARLRENGTPIRFRFRCDAPERRRLLAMEIKAEANSEIHFVVTSVVEQQREAVQLLETDRPHGESFVTICAWCKRIMLPSGRWCEVEEAVSTLELFQREPLPQLSHGACAECVDAIMEMLDDEDLAAGGSVAFDALPMG